MSAKECKTILFASEVSLEFMEEAHQWWDKEYIKFGRPSWAEMNIPERTKVISAYSRHILAGEAVDWDHIFDDDTAGQDHTDKDEVDMILKDIQRDMNPVGEMVNTMDDDDFYTDRYRVWNPLPWGFDGEQSKSFNDLNEAQAYADYLTQLVQDRDSDNDNQQYGSGGVVSDTKTQQDVYFGKARESNAVGNYTDPAILKEYDEEMEKAEPFYVNQDIRLEPKKSQVGDKATEVSLADSVKNYNDAETWWNSVRQDMITDENGNSIDVANGLGDAYDDLPMFNQEGVDTVFSVAKAGGDRKDLEKDYGFGKDEWFEDPEAGPY
jgi:hypothetical protein